MPFWIGQLHNQDAKVRKFVWISLFLVEHFDIDFQILITLKWEH